MAKKKYYAVKIGKRPGVYFTWAECEDQIKGVSGAVYEGFPDLESAQKFIEEDEIVIQDKYTHATITNEDVKSAISVLKDGEVIAFVDGSYLDLEKKAGFGAIIVDNLGVETTLYRAYSEKNCPSLLDLRNFAAELQGAMEVIKWAVSYGKKSIKLYYDYEGIEKFANGEWTAKNAFAKEYVSFIDDARNSIDLKFVKVPAHSGIEYNERVDAIAKQSLLEKGYKTYDDGSVYFIGYSADDWKAIVDCIDEENLGLNGENSKKTNFIVTTPSDGRQRIEIVLGKNKVVINCYRNSKSYVQGKQSTLFSKIVSSAISMLNNKEKVIETLNKVHVLTITQEEVETEFENVLPDYSDERDGKHYNNLLSAIYNTKIVGYMPDYTCLVTPIFRAYEKYLHDILGGKLGLITCRDDGSNNFAFFSKNSSGKYECNSSLISVLNYQQIVYLNNLYTTYRGIRHQYSHWSADDCDSAVIPDLNVAQGYLKDGLTIINDYYKLF